MLKITMKNDFLSLDYIVYSWVDREAHFGIGGATLFVMNKSVA